MIKIVRGVYGFMDKNGIVRPKTAADEPFALLPEQEERLVRIGVAEYVGSIEDEQADENEQGSIEDEQDPIGFDEIPPEDGEVDEAEIVGEPIDLKTLSAKELRELGKEYGLTFKANDKKETMIAAIADAQAAIAEDDESEPAPVFDASEAVQ